MIGSDGARKKFERTVAVALRQIAEDLIVGAVLFDDVDDVLEGRILRSASSRLFPVVRARDASRELRQLARLHVRRERSDRAVQLSERVIGTVARQLPDYTLGQLNGTI